MPIENPSGYARAYHIAMKERDEARREAKGLQDKLDFAAEQWGKSDREVDRRGKELAALREALEYYADPEIVIGRIIDGKIVAQLDSRARAALADTAAAAAQWVRVDNAEIEKWLITIEAHSAVIADPMPDDDPKELCACIRENVTSIRLLLAAAWASRREGDA